MAQGDINRQMDEIREDIASLRSDLSLLIETIRKEGEAKGRASYRAAHDKVQETAEQIEERLAEAQEAIGHQVESRPITSLLTTFGLGFVIGLLLDRHR